MTSPAHGSLALVLACCLGCGLPGCLERSDEEPGFSVHVMPRGARVPNVADDELLAMRIAKNAGAGGPLVPLHTGFVAGVEVRYWDFGIATSSVEPVWILERSGEPIDHPPIVDSLPGDDAYSPFRAIYTVAVGDAYDGERIASLAALEDAIQIELVAEPEATGTYVSWPIVPTDFSLERPGDEPLTNLPIYCQGKSARYLPMRDAQPFERSVSTRTAYTLRRQHELTPLEEAAVGADLNGDGDQLDGNVIFESAEMTSGLWSQVEITVAGDYVFGAYRAETDLFARDEMDEPMPVPDAFIARTESEDPLYRPLYPTETQ